MTTLNELGRVLCVDDDAALLAGLSRNLRRHFPVTTANSAQEALELLRKDRTFAVIISDMRMPGMDGAQFFAEARQFVPNAVRVLLTGQADMSAVVHAINEGRIYRYLTKPVEKDTLIQVVQAAMAQYRLTVEERAASATATRQGLELALQTLSVSAPDAFGRAVRAGGLAADVADALGLSSPFDVEAACGLLELAREAQVPLSALAVGIDGLDGARRVAEEVQAAAPSGRLSVAARVASAALWFEVAASHRDATGALKVLEAERGVEARVLNEVRKIVEARGLERRVPLAELEPGACLAQAVFTNDGAVFLPHGVELTPFLLARLRGQPVGRIEAEASIVVEPTALAATG